MTLDFNSRGDLYQTIQLKFHEFVLHFVTTLHRSQLVSNARSYIELFYRCNCKTVYVGGSFVSKKVQPADIDLCFDLTGVNPKKLEELFPAFFDVNEKGKIRRDLKCHIFHFDNEDTRLFDLLNENREGFRKGIVKLDIKDILSYYDQK